MSCPLCPEDWEPFCDTCGDHGCPDCKNGTVENHDHERWEREEEQRIREDVRRLAESGITPW